MRHADAPVPNAMENIAERPRPSKEALRRSRAPGRAPRPPCSGTPVDPSGRRCLDRSGVPATAPLVAARSSAIGPRSGFPRLSARRTRAPR